MHLLMCDVTQDSAILFVGETEYSDTGPKE